MAPFVFTNGRLWLAGYNLSGDLNAIALDCGAEAKEATVLTDEARKNKGGLKTLALQCEGYWDSGSGEPDDVIFSRVGSGGIPVSVSAEGGAEGDVGYCFEAMAARYMQRGDVGEMYGFSVEASASGDTPLVRGTVLENGAQSGNGNGTGRELGTVSATQRLYVSAHVLALGAGTSLVMTVQSDDGAGFASPTSRIALAAKTAAGQSEFASVAGAITDTFYRINYAFTGGTTTATVVVVVGIK